MEPYERICKALAGSLFEDLIHNRQSALRNLHNSDEKVRLASIVICQLVWNCSDGDFLAACQTLAAHDGNKDVRIQAIRSMGDSLTGKSESGPSTFLADLVMSDRTPSDLRLEAYWALRRIQLGDIEEDRMKRRICLIKSESAQYSLHQIEDLKRGALPAEAQSGFLWDSAEAIDYEFVRRFATGRLPRVEDAPK